MDYNAFIIKLLVPRYLKEDIKPDNTKEDSNLMINEDKHAKDLYSGMSMILQLI